MNSKLRPSLGLNHKVTNKSIYWLFHDWTGCNRWWYKVKSKLDCFILMLYTTKRTVASLVEGGFFRELAPVASGHNPFRHQWVKLKRFSFFFVKNFAFSRVIPHFFRSNSGEKCGNNPPPKKKAVKSGNFSANGIF